MVERCDAGGDGFDVGDDTPRNIGGYQSGIHRFEGEWVVEKVVAVSVFHLGRPPVIGGDGFAFQRVDEVGGAGGVSISACYIGAGECVGITTAADFDGLRVGVERG